MNIPAQITAGDTVKWRDVATKDNLGNTVDSAGWTLTYYLRTDKANHGATIVGVAYGTGWELTIPAATSAAFDPGHWFWQAIATQGTTKITLGAGGIDVAAALSYGGLQVLVIDLDPQGNASTALGVDHHPCTVMGQPMGSQGGFGQWHPSA